uniref:PNOC protein n=1 Tax=Dromaius novaehollandiae TaxID=8790 RepID=A0A8C4JXT5_DRONO
MNQHVRPPPSPSQPVILAPGCVFGNKAELLDAFLHHSAPPHRCQPSTSLLHPSGTRSTQAHGAGLPRGDGREQALLAELFGRTASGGERAASQLPAPARAWHRRAAPPRQRWGLGPREPYHRVSSFSELTARGVQKRYGGFIGVRKSARKWNNQKRFSEFLKQYLGMSPRSSEYDIAADLNEHNEI